MRAIINTANKTLEEVEPLRNSYNLIIDTDDNIHTGTRKYTEDEYMMLVLGKLDEKRKEDISNFVKNHKCIPYFEDEVGASANYYLSNIEESEVLNAIFKK